VKTERATDHEEPYTLHSSIKAVRRLTKAVARDVFTVETHQKQNFKNVMLNVTDVHVFKNNHTRLNFHTSVQRKWNNFVATRCISKL